jgi:hypothetical protein
MSSLLLTYDRFFSYFRVFIFAVALYVVVVGILIDVVVVATVIIIVHGSMS